MNNVEIEYKFKVENFEKILGKLSSLGADFQSENEIVDIYFILGNNEEGRKYLRLREKNRKGEISYSFAESESHTLEWETQVGSVETMKLILEKLELDVDVKVEKLRKTYKLGDSEIVLDEVKHLGNFVEIESASLDELLQLMKKLGLEENERIKGAGYPDLIKKIKAI